MREKTVIGDLRAIKKRLQIWWFLTTIFVDDEFDFNGNVGVDPVFSATFPCFSISVGVRCDGLTSTQTRYYKRSLQTRVWICFLISFIAKILLFPLRIYDTLNKMTDNIRRAMQDIDLGSEVAPFVLPHAVVQQAAEENRFILVGRPTMPRRQNIRAIIAAMPRSWGLEGLVRGRTMEGRRFQFVFPSEEAMETVIRRGPWAYADRMITLQQWSPLMDMNLLNKIPFWIQVRGIPFQFMNREVIIHIARALGEYIQIDYNEEVGGRMEFVRIRLNWNINSPLHFQRNFQFTPGVNTLLKLHYERLRGFCETCGMMTHDSGRCLIQNGGPEEDPDEDNDDDNNQGQDDQRHHDMGVYIEEINDEGANMGAQDDIPEEPVMQEAEMPEQQVEETVEKEDDFWSGESMGTMYSGDLNMEEMYASKPFVPRHDGSQVLKRKIWMSETTDNKMKFSEETRGERSSQDGDKRKKKIVSEEMKGAGTSEGPSNMWRGAVGPEPPLPP
ncbi:uncharacterized protein LOC106349924 [Brassica napus]|uniref:uncharacterized protein LOC106349924 n=1 Tax=Brassica napus TaxID=3708 RepID=UPI0006AB6E70|nr:uncharacterized protein LOC106349924 [Brassica napus]